MAERPRLVIALVPAWRLLARERAVARSTACACGAAGSVGSPLVAEPAAPARSAPNMRRPGRANRAHDNAMEQHPGALRKADVVLITDGGSSAERAPALRARAAAFGVTVLGMGIGVEPAPLRAWCDEAHGVVDLDRVDEKGAEALFGA